MEGKDFVAKKTKNQIKTWHFRFGKHVTLINDSTLCQHECVDLWWNSIGVNINIKKFGLNSQLAFCMQNTWAWQVVVVCWEKHYLFLHPSVYKLFQLSVALKWLFALEISASTIVQKCFLTRGSTPLFFCWRY